MANFENLGFVWHVIGISPVPTESSSRHSKSWLFHSYQRIYTFSLQFLYFRAVFSWLQIPPFLDDKQCSWQKPIWESHAACLSSINVSITPYKIRSLASAHAYLYELSTHAPTKMLKNQIKTTKHKANHCTTTSAHLTVLSAPNFPNYFIILLIAPIHSQCLIVPIISWPVDIHVRVYSKNWKRQREKGKLNCVRY